MSTVIFRNETYIKTMDNNSYYYYLLTKIFNNNNNWHQIKMHYVNNTVASEYIFKWGEGGGHTEGVKIMINV